MITELIIRNRKGASAVEFAIILLILLSLVFGIIEFSLYLFNKHVITWASREGARAGIVQRVPRVSEADIKQKVRDYCEDYVVIFANPKPEPGISVSLDNIPSAICPQAGFGHDLAVEVIIILLDGQ
jgi:hypothetical protein